MSERVPAGRSPGLTVMAGRVPANMRTTAEAQMAGDTPGDDGDNGGGD